MATKDTTRKPRLGLRMFLMLLLTLLIVGGLFAIKAVIGKQTNAFFDNMPQPAAAITTAEASQQSWSASLEAVGTLVAVNGTDVTTEAGGVVRRIAFDAGQPVKAGQLLVELNSSNEMATLKSLEASANLAAVQAERWQALARDQLVSAAEAEERTTTAATARAAVDAQRALIAQKTVRAPFDGVLGIRRVNLGQFVAPGDPIVSLQSLDPIYIDFSLPEQHLPAITDGAAIRVSVDAIPGESFHGTITAIEPAVDASTRNFKVQATLRNPDGKLRPGTFARVALDLGGPSQVIVIPQTAVSFNPYGNSVYVVSEVDRAEGETDMQGQPLTGKKLIVRQRFVTTGATRGDLVEVTDGLAPGEVIATSGLLKLRNDGEVTVNNAVQPTADETPTPDNR